jgi:hypothetical protein
MFKLFCLRRTKLETRREIKHRRYGKSDDSATANETTEHRQSIRYDRSKPKLP